LIRYIHRDGERRQGNEELRDLKEQTKPEKDEWVPWEYNMQKGRKGAM